MPSHRQSCCWLYLGGVGLYALLSSAVRANIVTVGTVGPAQAQPGPAFVIPESLGSRAGANLFHSFQQFNVGGGEQTTFTGSSSSCQCDQPRHGGAGDRTSFFYTSLRVLKGIHE